jgi:predicted DNA-binding protein
VISPRNAQSRHHSRHRSFAAKRLGAENIVRNSWWRQLVDFMRWRRASSSTRATASLPAELVARIDQVAAQLNQTRTDVIRAALELYIDEAEDLLLVLERLEDRGAAPPDRRAIKRGQSND